MISTTKNLKDLYVDLNANLPRYQKLKELHAAKFGAPIDFAVRAPGRVNVMGEHIDYSYFSVLPMAIGYDAIMAVTLTDKPEVRVVNTNPNFEDAAYEIPETGDVHIDSVKLHWSNYMKAGYTVATRYLRKTNPSLKPKGMLISMTGNVPDCGGLSSSAAFVVAATLTTLKANGVQEVSKKTLVELSITSEQLLGMNSGGMDQSASVFGEVDHALLISFRPELKAVPMSFSKTDVPLAFLVGNSLVTSIKHETAPIHYNLRVVEVTLAANILAKELGLTIPQDGNLNAGTLRGVLDAQFKTTDVKAENLKAMDALVEKYLKPEGYTKEEAAQALGITVEELTAKYLTEFPVRFEKLKLYHRAKHVYLETIRVLDFVNTLNTGGPGSEKVLGDIMNASHKSAQDYFENSHPDVDLLVKVAREAGSLGSRVTGAGWGGATVHLVPAEKATAIKKAIREHYYDKVRPGAPEDALIETVPASGVAILDVAALDF